MRCSALGLIWTLGVILKTTPDGRETIVVMPRKSSLERNLVIPVVKWGRTGGKKVLMKMRMSCCGIVSA